MQRSFCVRWGGWISKVMAVLIAAIYLFVISFVQSSPYVWLSLILLLMLCLILFAYTREKPIIRWRRRGNSGQQTTNQNEGPEMTEVPAAVWMTDIPPSYSYVMETNAPVTPPPSYGSALVMFPWIATGQQSPDITRLIQNAKFRSVSRQVSESSAIYNCSGSLSRQTSRMDALSTGITVSTISRQNSRQDEVSTARQLSVISRQTSHATVLSRQISKQEEVKQQKTKMDDKSEVEENSNNNTLTIDVDVDNRELSAEMSNHLEE